MLNLYTTYSISGLLANTLNVYNSSGRFQIIVLRRDDYSSVHFSILPEALLSTT